MAKSITAPDLIGEEAPENRPSMLLVHSRFWAFTMEYAVIRGKHSASRWPCHWRSTWGWLEKHDQLETLQGIELIMRLPAYQPQIEAQ